jgi:hypothetical protein
MAKSQKSQLKMLLREPERLLMREPVKPARHPVEDSAAFIGGILLGALIGGLAAILLAPSDGQSLRKRVKGMLGMGDFEDDAPIQYIDPSSTGTSPAEAEEVSGPVGMSAVGAATGA